VLLLNKWKSSNPSLAAGFQASKPAPSLSTLQHRRGDFAQLPAGWVPSLCENVFIPAGPGEARAAAENARPRLEVHPEAVDPFYLFACHVDWELRGEPSAAWELISASLSAHEDTRAQARALLAGSERIASGKRAPCSTDCRTYEDSCLETSMKTVYGLGIIESCRHCPASAPGFFCSFSTEVVQSLDKVSQHSVLPAGTVLFVEGELPRGIFILCSGKVRLSTTSREGKMLILKTAAAGEAIGLSAAISGLRYEMTADTATPCQLNFVDRKSLLELLQSHGEFGVHAAQSLSRESQEAYRDIHELILARSSAGKLARLLLSCSPRQTPEASESRLSSTMTHEEMAQRIGSSRETVTRLLSDLKKKELIRLDGGMLVIRNRTALEAIAV
jgi:CRP/FNR family transcriptional regulator, cyclic AMP receptor protein